MYDDVCMKQEYKIPELVHSHFNLAAKPSILEECVLQLLFYRISCKPA